MQPRPLVQRVLGNMITLWWYCDKSWVWITYQLHWAQETSLLPWHCWQCTDSFHPPLQYYQREQSMLLGHWSQWDQRQPQHLEQRLRKNHTVMVYWWTWVWITYQIHWAQETSLLPWHCWQCTDIFHPLLQILSVCCCTEQSLYSQLSEWEYEHCHR